MKAAVMSAAAVDFAHKALHLLQRVAQHQNIISRQQQGSDFGKFAHRRSVRIGHDLTESVHGHVEVVHPFPLPAVDLEADRLQLIVRKSFTVFFCKPEGEGLFVGRGEAPQARDI